MILSVSRRTDIPNYYSEWFYNRIKEGYVYVRNPMNFHQISKINLSPDIVDCVVFWTKNPKNMMERLEELNKYKYYFQFTLNGYGSSVEKNVPPREETIALFQKLSSRIGKERVVWRYDPIFLDTKFTLEYHIDNFRYIYERVKDYTQECIISFIDIYEKNRNRIDDMRQPNEKEIKEFVSKIPMGNGLIIKTCAEKIDLAEYGIEHASCIDQNKIEQIIGLKIKSKKDSSQRTECNCIESREIGCYNSCLNGCRYCYANYEEDTVKRNVSMHDKKSPLLIGNIEVEDKITEPKISSIKKLQYDIFDFVGE